ncbi:MAG: hypothetical protein LN560_04940 [Rickettsia endosymbiont of Sceptobius lativentris]|nr:hypothetical protein [Rickettsia endosymbiont of Sceptobius lativentris]
MYITTLKSLPCMIESIASFNLSVSKFIILLLILFNIGNFIRINNVRGKPNFIINVIKD